MNKNIIMYQEEKINKSTAWLLFLFLGWSYGNFGQIGKQLLYWFTLAGFGLWWFYILFTLNSKIKKHNDELRMKYNV